MSHQMILFHLFLIENKSVILHGAHHKFDTSLNFNYVTSNAENKFFVFDQYSARDCVDHIEIGLPQMNREKNVSFFSVPKLPKFNLNCKKLKNKLFAKSLFNLTVQRKNGLCHRWNSGNVCRFL